ncbi:conserved protein of unknown function (plasmid) [Cupriavidus taiwanensis]|uniref:Uncharacterized protein n=2 Tax=Cupriavidus taiwanensis TaxID=164546 RepID=A0A375IP16_9BURK|nr:conserved protein of unknown function [Cupriavidus taiwanensis]
MDLVSAPLLPYPRARVQVARSAHGMACVAIRRLAQASPACRRHAGKRRA